MEIQRLNLGHTARDGRARIQSLSRSRVIVHTEFISHNDAVRKVQSLCTFFFFFNSPTLD